MICGRCYVHDDIEVMIQWTGLEWYCDMCGEFFEEV